MCFLASPTLTFTSQLLSMSENFGGEEKSLHQGKKKREKHPLLPFSSL